MSQNVPLWHNEHILHDVVLGLFCEIIDPMEIKRVAHNTCTLVLHL